MMRTVKVPFLASVPSLRSAYTLGAIALSAAVLFGCPVYGSSGQATSLQCDSLGNCCDQYSGNCTVWNCDYSGQCPYGASCSASGVCVSNGYNYGFDGGPAYEAGTTSEAGTDATVDCSQTGCPTGYVCTLTNGLAQCLSAPDAGGDATVGPGADGGTDAVTVLHDAGAADAQDAQTTPPFSGCTSDSACATDGGAGARCLDGVCVAAANECSDSTQCPILGTTQEQCVQGVCTPSCAGGATCPSGYSCNDATQVCTGNPTPCGAADGGAACASGTTCVDERCVPLCATTAGSDAAPSCTGAGLVCVDHGCIPDQKPQFICAHDGVQDSCAAGSICLHHNCYIACTLTADGGTPADGGNGCKVADNFNVCKPVTTANGTFDVCGSTSNLGSACDPTLAKACSNPADICIDGYCR